MEHYKILDHLSIYAAATLVKVLNPLACVNELALLVGLCPQFLDSPTPDWRREKKAAKSNTSRLRSK